MTVDDNKRINTDVDTLKTKDLASPTNENVALSLDENTDFNSLACMLGEDSRIIIRGGQVLIENMSDDLLDLALSLNPNDAGLKQRQAELKSKKNEENS